MTLGVSCVVCGHGTLGGKSARPFCIRCVVNGDASEYLERIGREQRDDDHLPKQATR